MDVLSEVLRAVKLDGAVFFNGEFAAPWCVREPDPGPWRRTYRPKPITSSSFIWFSKDGAMLASKQEDRTVPLMAGDIMIFPHGDAHLMGNGPPVPPVDTSQQLRQILAEGRVLSQLGGGGELTRLICGYMTCDAQLSGVFLAGPAGDTQSQYQGYAVGTVAGRYAPIFRRSCGELRPRQRCCHRQVIRSAVRGNVATLRCAVTA